MAIQDALTGTVVTILPLDCHANLAWPISQEDCDSAKKLWKEFSQVRDVIDETPSIKPSIFVISVHYLDSTQMQRMTRVQKVVSNSYDNKITRHTQRICYLCKSRTGCCAKRNQPQNIYGISIRHGQNGMPVYFDLEYVLS